MTTEEIDNDHDDRDSDEHAGHERHDRAAEAGGCYTRKELEAQQEERIEAQRQWSEPQARIRSYQEAPEWLESIAQDAYSGTEEQAREGLDPIIARELIAWDETRKGVDEQIRLQELHRQDHDPQRQEPEPTARGNVDENGAQRTDRPRNERTHPDPDAGEAGQKVSRKPKGGKRDDNAELVRSPGDKLEALISALVDIDAVVRGERNWCVVHADCVDVMGCLPDDLVSHVITDPPYSAEVHARSIRRTYLPDVADQPCRRTRKHAFGFEHITREQTQALAPEFLRLSLRWVLAFADMETSEWWHADFGEEYVRMGAWVKDRAMPQISGDRPGSRLEHVVIAHRKGRKSWNGGGDGNVWQHPVVANCSGHRNDRVHTAQKPESLMVELVGLFTDPGDIILDPFAGSGTTGVAALRLGRRAILIEKDEQYAQLCVDRMRAEESFSTLQAHRAGQLSLLAGKAVR